MQNSTKQELGKRNWRKPEVKRLEAGAAESTHNANSDGGGGNQGS
jgi:hypothetical protein